MLDNVQFAYPARPDIQVCKGYNLTIEPGETVAFVGRSGAGKSTVMNLLLRFYDPQGGDITLDGNSIKDLNIRYLRSQMGYVGQEPVLFTGTVAENIAYGIPPSELETLSKEETRRRVVEAAKLANAHDFISTFPNGYDTDVGSNGVAMSGGQKQRIAIARALVKKPAVLLLDEVDLPLESMITTFIYARLLLLWMPPPREWSKNPLISSRSRSLRPPSSLLIVYPPFVTPIRLLL